MKKKRIIFINLHINALLVRPFWDHVLHKVIVPKNMFVLDYLLRNGYEVCAYIDRRGTRWKFNSYRRLRAITPLFYIIEFYLTMFMNRKYLDTSKIKRIKNVGELDRNSVIIEYSFDPDSMLESESPAWKAVSLLHLYGGKKESEIVRKQNPDLLFAESNLRRHSELYKRNYKWFEGDFILLPFVYQSRFQDKRKFSERKNKAMAIGTLTVNDDPEAIALYGTNAFQPQRELILEHRTELAERIDCFISRREEEGTKKEITGKEGYLEGIYKRIFNSLHAEKQKKYFSFDMVDKFNEYRMFLCPEDGQGNPGIGFVEGMACGCAYIGQNYGVYEDYGMIEGVHYIGYDGTLEDLKKKIAYYQEEAHRAALSEIACRGYEFVKKNFEEKKVARDFIEALMESCGDGAEGGA